MAQDSRKAILPVFTLFLLSGATGLAYLVVRTRELIRVFGAQYLAVSAVLGDFQKSLEFYPDKDWFVFSMASMYLNLGDTLSAIDYYERLLEITPRRKDAADDLAWVYAVRGEHLERALELSLKATVANPTPFNYYTLGWVYYRMGDFDRAQEALEINSGWVESIYHLAIVHLGKGDVGTAEGLFDEVIRTDRTGYFKALAQENLDEL